MIIKDAKYLTSVTSRNDIIKDNVPEFAFVGRSNVGKSSLINVLIGKKRLAKTSSTPGLTKMVNYFLINNALRFVDLPGYGYARLAREDSARWQDLIEGYLTESSSLTTVFVLVDIRHKPSDLDKQMLKFLIYNGLPFMILATKADKLSKAQQKKQLSVIAKELSIREEMVIPTSSESRLGVDRILDYIESKVAN